ncbi:MAG: PAS domain S-box protein, partial [Gemmatimonadaceae bacterium]|nr:PAS domain S-box protein [Gemmatimonadaceae bacterium]
MTSQQSLLLAERFDGLLDKIEAVLWTVGEVDSAPSPLAMQVYTVGKEELDGRQGDRSSTSQAAAAEIRKASSASKQKRGKLVVVEPAKLDLEPFVWAGLVRADSAVGMVKIPLRVLDSIARTGTLPDAGVTIISASGRVLAHNSGGAKWIGENISATALGSQLISRQRPVFIGRGLEGLQKVFAVQPIQQTGWKVLVGSPMEKVVAQARYGFLRAVAWGTLALALALITALWQAQRLINRLTQLSAKASAYARGEFSARTNVSGNDELGRLGESMDRMADALQKRELDLRSSEERYRVLFDANPVPMYVFDSVSFEMLDVNKASLEKYGYTEEEFLGLSADSLRPASDIGEFRDYVSSIGDRTVRSIRRRHRAKDGRLIDVEIDSAPTEFRGRTARLAAAYDVTAQLAAEQSLRTTELQLRRSQKMESMGQLTGGIAHDFNNVLTVIRSYAELLQATLSPDDDRLDDLKEIIKAQERAAALTRQLLAFSRQQLLQRQKINLSLLVEETRGLLTPLVSERTELNIVLPDASVTISADQTQLIQVLINLVANARDATSDGGRIDLVVTSCRLTTEMLDSSGCPIPSAEYGELSISDNGPGIPPEIQGLIFEPFFTTKSVGKGTGMGLSTVYGIVKQLDGYILLDSVIGKGTTFRLLFPCVSGEAEERPSSSGNVLTGGTESILLVEDERAVRAAAERILSAAGYVVVTASDGIEALAIADSPYRIDLVLTDLVMPRMGGIELAENLARKKMPVKTLFMT